MRIVEIRSLENGAHRNQTVFGGMTPPDGWAVIPDDMETENFPFGSITVEEIDGIQTVTSWTPGAMPEPEQEPTPVPTPRDDIDAMLVDHEYRLALLELGLTE